jgi:hypothetical protein
MWLPDVNGAGLEELASGGGADGNVDADISETTWCAYAWPTNYGNTGNRTFFVNQGGDIVATEDNTYSGTASAPPGNSAFSGAGNTITGPVATGMTGRDTNFWKQAG